MAGIADAVTDMLALLNTNTSFKYVRVFNNQFQYMEEQAIEAFPMPCCFVEVSGENENAGMGYTVADLLFKIHIGAVEYDAGDGTMGQNLSIFALRDEVVALLTYKELTGCSGLQKVNEAQDFSHTNVYHYIVEFKCSQVDSKGQQEAGMVENTPPVVLDLNITINN